MGGSRIGALYFAVRKGKFFRMARLSAQSLKDTMNIETLLFSNLDLPDPGPFDEIIKTELPPQKSMWLYKWDCLLRSPFGITLHLDADTYVCKDFSEIFRMIDRFDVVMPYSPYLNLDSPPQGVPGCFPEPAGGLILWKWNERTRELFERIRKMLEYRSFRRADEPTIREALYKSDVQFGIVPTEYTCVFRHQGYLSSDVRIMHGKVHDIKAEAELFNSVTGPRVFTGETLFSTQAVKGRIREVDKGIGYLWKRGQVYDFPKSTT